VLQSSISSVSPAAVTAYPLPSAIAAHGAAQESGIGLVPGSGSIQEVGSDMVRLLAMELNALREAMVVHTSGRQVKEPAVYISPEARAWSPVQFDPKKHRHAWPLKTSQSPLISTEFVDWFRTRGLIQNSMDICLQGLNYFFSMLRVDSVADNEFPHIGFVQALIRGSLFQELLGLPLMSTRYSWTRKMVFAFDHFVNYCAIEAAKHNLADAQRYIGVLQKDLLASLKKNVSKKHKERMITKNAADAARLAKMAPVDELKRHVRQAMLDLGKIHKTYVGKDSLPPMLHLAANTAIVGIIYSNGFGGRSQEWQVMPLTHVRAQLKKDLDYLVCPNHKTAHVYGELGKHLQPGTLGSIERYIELPRSDRDLFLDPPSADAAHVHVAQMLRRFGKSYGPQYQYPTVNLWRKWYHTEIEKPENARKAMDFLARIDGHSVDMARKVYVTKNPEQDALFSKHLVKSVLGECVPWPSDAEIEADGNDLEVIAKRAASVVDNPDDSDDEDCPDDELALVLPWDENADLAGTKAQAIVEPQSPVQCSIVPISDRPEEHDCQEQTQETERESESVTGSAASVASSPLVVMVDDELGTEVVSLKKRRINYNQQTGEFEKFDPQPNIIDHPEPPPMLQTAVSDFFGSSAASAAPSRRRHPTFSSEQIQWILARRDELLFTRVNPPPNNVIKEFVRAGIEAELFSLGGTSKHALCEKFRSICRIRE